MNSTMQSLNSPLVSQNQHHQHSIHQQAYCFCWHYFALSMELISNLIYFLFSSPFCPCSIRVLNCQHNCKIGPSGVRALPLAAGINEGGHYFRYIFPLFFSSSSSSYHRYSKPQKGLSYCFKFLHGPLKKNNKNLGKQKI